MNNNIFVDYKTVDRTKISFDSYQSEYKTTLKTVLYDGKLAIFKLPNHNKNRLGIEISPLENQFLELLDYIQEQMPKSISTLNIHNIYHRDRDHGRPIKIYTRGIGYTSIKICGYDNGSSINFDITHC